MRAVKINFIETLILGVMLICGGGCKSQSEKKAVPADDGLNKEKNSQPDNPGSPGEASSGGSGGAGDDLTNPRSWQLLANSPQGKYWNHDDIKFVDKNTGWICDIAGRIWRTTDGGLSFEKQVDQPGSSFRALAFFDSKRGFAGTLGPGSWVKETVDDTLLYQTSDGGESWAEVKSLQSSDTVKGICGMRTIDAATIYGVGRYDGPAAFIRTTDGGETWTAKTVDAADTLVDLHFFDAKRGVLGGGKGGKAVILYTNDGGESFRNVATSVNDHIWKLFFLDATTGYGMISDYQKNSRRFYLKTVDGGLTWSEVAYSPEVKEYEGLGIGFYTKDLGWAAGDKVTYKTTDGGVTFSAVNLDPFGTDTINRFIRVDDIMYAIGVHVYKYTNETLDTSSLNLVDHEKASLAFSPNPFQGVGKITYHIPIEAKVSIGVTSVGGRLIELLVDKEQKPGSYSIVYNPEYNQRFVGITLLAGPYRQHIKVYREQGQGFPQNY